MLCKKLWGELSNCPEIKKNGRTGQAQHGVDVYGISAGEDAYFGIQCKGKEEYTDKQFTESEITGEISNALQFSPALKKLYFATTAVKDAPIEAFMRKKILRTGPQDFLRFIYIAGKISLTSLMKIKLLRTGISKIKTTKLTTRRN